MDEEGVALMERSPDASLTESWNVVDAQEVNNGGSEGSDGESIEVIDEDAHLENCTDDGSALKSEYSNIHPVCEGAVDSTCSEERCTHEHVSDNEGIEIIHPINETQNVSTGSINMLVALVSIGFLVSLTLGGSAVFICLYKFEEYAFNHLMGLISPFSYPENNINNEYQQLLDQIKTYKEESQDLKGIVADLNAAVVNLKNELASKNTALNSKGSVKHIPNSGNQLFEQLLSINSGNFPNINESEDYIPEKYEHSFRVIEEMLNRLTAGREREENLETIKLFYLIPKHLAVLNAHSSTNDNIRHFIVSWKEKLATANENLIADMNEMQLKMIRHTVKHLKNSEKSFFKKLCELKDLKKTECYEVFIKPYENSSNDAEEMPELLQNENKYVSNNEEESNAFCNSKSSKNHCMKQKETKGNKIKLNPEINNPPKDDEKFNDKSSPKSKCSNQNQRNQPTRPSLKNKGMAVDFVPIKDKKAGDESNSFSSFSGAGGEGSCVEGGRGWGRRTGSGPSEGGWFLSLGTHRALVRRAQVRADWLFDRARYRRRRTSFFRQPSS